MLDANEKWVKGYEMEYSINDEGIVFSHNYMNTGRKHPLKTPPDDRGYNRVGLCKNGKVKDFKIHRLVMETFGISEPKPQINHIDGDKSNNCIDNLEWVTSWENIHHSWETGLSKSRHSGGRKRVLQLLDGEIIGEYIGVMDASRRTNIDPSSISRVCKGTQSHAGNYIWKYKEEL